jgi:hypothetical protein
LEGFCFGGCGEEGSSYFPWGYFCGFCQGEERLACFCLPETYFQGGFLMAGGRREPNLILAVQVGA